MDNGYSDSSPRRAEEARNIVRGVRGERRTDRRRGGGKRALSVSFLPLLFSVSPLENGGMCHSRLRSVSAWRFYGAFRFSPFRLSLFYIPFFYNFIIPLFQ